MAGETLTRVRKILFALKNQQLRRALGHGVGAAIEHRVLRNLFTPNVVLVVGANKGQFMLTDLYC